jgi:hypothetical protein
LAIISTRRVSAIAIALCLALGGGGFVSHTRAQGSQVDLNAAEVMRQTLEANAGKRVKLRLISGQDIDGQIAKVGAHAVLLTELTGAEFFDATIRLDQVAAVIARRPGK